MKETTVASIDYRSSHGPKNPLFGPSIRLHADCCTVPRSGLKVVREMFKCCITRPRATSGITRPRSSCSVGSLERLNRQPHLNGDAQLNVGTLYPPPHSPRRGSSVASLSGVVGGWWWPVQAVFYLVTGIVWIAPLKPLLRWMETGRWR